MKEQHPEAAQYKELAKEMKFHESKLTVPSTKKALVDIDETICFYEGKRRYDLSIPNYENIAKINKLYDEGHTIVFYTARGLKSGRGEKHYRPITEQQLKEWGVKYHELCFKGHNGDYFIDDRGINAEDFFK